MKTFLTLLVVALVLTFSGCTKDKSVSNNSSPLTGQWNWVTSFDFLAIKTPQSTGKNWELAFMQNLSFVQTGTLYPNNTGIYELTNDSVYLKFSGDSIRHGYRYTITNDTLMLDAGMQFDQSAHFFTKME